MSADTGFLALQLIGPMQSWGFDSQYNRRNTSLMPTKSAIAGMCCAAKGYARGGDAENDFLKRFSELKMLSIAIPRFREYKKNSSVRRQQLELRRLQDYHTVQNTRRANGNLNPDCVLTYRQYLNDASFGVVLSGGKAFLEEIAVSLADPKWGIWLGRKACIPSAPLLASKKGESGGVKESQESALMLIIGDELLDNFVYQVDAESFFDGKDSLPDEAVSFATEDRQFSPRRISTHEPIRRAEQ